MECDGCTVCCKLIEIPWMDSPRGEYCKECEPNVGCRIYDHAPEECLKFRCAYNQVPKCNINLRPDKLGIIFDKITDDVFIGTVNPDVLISEEAQKQVALFVKEGFGVVLFNDKISKPMVFSPKGKNPREIWNEVLRIREFVVTEIQNANIVIHKKFHLNGQVA